MAKWRIEALERLPELRRTVDAADSIMALWIELGFAYEDAIFPPENRDLIQRIEAYAEWCANAPRNNDPGRDPPTAVTVAFYEHLDEMKSRLAGDSDNKNEPRCLRNHSRREGT
jgi:hypothetical protein